MTSPEEQIGELKQRISTLETQVKYLEELLLNKYPLMPPSGTNPDDVLDVIRKWEVVAYEV